MSFVLIFVGNIALGNSVKGYFRKNGTYVQPHERSAPDSNRWNNYGPSGGSGYKAPNQRDSDKDGTPNYRDTDDNNNGVHDNNE